MGYSELWVELVDCVLEHDQKTISGMARFLLLLSADKEKGARKKYKSCVGRKPLANWFSYSFPSRT